MQQLPLAIVDGFSLLILLVGTVVVLGGGWIWLARDPSSTPSEDLERLYREGLSSGTSIARLNEIDAELQRRDEADRERMKKLRASMSDGQLESFFTGAYRGGSDAATEGLGDAAAAHAAGVVGVLRARQAFDPPLRGLRKDQERILQWEARPFLAADPSTGHAAIVAYALWREGSVGVDLAPVRDAVEAWISTKPDRRRMEVASLRGFKFPWLDLVT